MFHYGTVQLRLCYEASYVSGAAGFEVFAQSQHSVPEYVAMVWVKSLAELATGQ